MIGFTAATDKNDHASMHNHDWSAALLMIAMAGGHGHHEQFSGLITLALDTTDAATNSNSLLPVLPGLASLVDAVEAF